jgi:hypothetical protein
MPEPLGVDARSTSVDGDRRGPWLTPHADVNHFVKHFADTVTRTLPENLAGVYLTGSLSYDAFEYHSSDIDFTVIVRRPVSTSELGALTKLHRGIEERFEEWSRRLECSYTPLEMLPSIRPPREGRPWYWGGTRELYAEARYGNEWIINRHFLHEHGVALHGPAFTTLAGPVDMLEVQKACIRDLFAEWRPKRSDEAWLGNSHHQAYFVLNLCRIMHTVCTGLAGPKRVAAGWVKETFDAQWTELVDRALQWRYGLELDRREEAVAFLDYVISVVSETDLYRRLASEKGAGL